MQDYKSGDVVVLTADSVYKYEQTHFDPKTLRYKKEVKTVPLPKGTQGKFMYWLASRQYAVLDFENCLSGHGVHCTEFTKA